MSCTGRSLTLVGRCVRYAPYCNGQCQHSAADATIPAQSFGWETYWTCDGTQYINGAANRAGFVQIRAVMRQVDRTIKVSCCQATVLYLGGPSYG